MVRFHGSWLDFQVAFHGWIFRFGFFRFDFFRLDFMVRFSGSVFSGSFIQPVREFIEGAR